MKQSYLYVLIVGFVAGILFRSFFDLGFSFSIFLFALSSSIFLLQRLTYPQQGPFLLKGFGVVLFIFSAGLGMSRFDLADFNKGDYALDKILGQEIIAEGVIIDEPDEREGNVKLIVLADKILNPTEEKLKSRVIVTTDIYPQFEYGDRVSIKGKIVKPKNFINEDGEGFDYVSYLAKDNIFYQMFYPNLEFISNKHGSFIKRNLFIFKHLFLEKIEKVIPDPQASLLGGLVVGAKQSLGEELQDDFRKTGIIHIVVLSGYNVTIVAEAIMRFFSFLPYIFGVSIGAIAIIFFAILTGGSATIVRASIMALFVLLARATGRTQTITRALFIAGFFMLLHNPKILVFDSSFQLSFIATIGLIYLAPKIEKYFHLVPTKFQLREFAMATVATQIFVLPMLLYKMGELSLVALPVNLLILMFVSITMFFGFITGILGFISVFISLPFAYITNALLTYQLKVVEIFASLPFASIKINYFPIWFAILIYIIYGIFIWKFRNKNQIL